jgi:hypothetical protein
VEAKEHGRLVYATFRERQSKGMFAVIAVTGSLTLVFQGKIV